MEPIAATTPQRSTACSARGIEFLRTSTGAEMEVTAAARRAARPNRVGRLQESAAACVGGLVCKLSGRRGAVSNFAIVRVLSTEYS